MEVNSIAFLGHQIMTPSSVNSPTNSLLNVNNDIVHIIPLIFDFQLEYTDKYVNLPVIRALLNGSDGKAA